jgi:hypothetical protein
MKRFSITSKRLFKGTVLLLGIPAFLLLPLTVLLLFPSFNGIWAYAGGFETNLVFSLSRLQITIIAGGVLGFLVFLFVNGRRLLRRYRTPHVR